MRKTRQPSCPPRTPQLQRPFPLTVHVHLSSGQRSPNCLRTITPKPSVVFYQGTRASPDQLFPFLIHQSRPLLLIFDSLGATRTNEPDKLSLTPTCYLKAQLTSPARDPGLLLNKYLIWDTPEPIAQPTRNSEVAVGPLYSVQLPSSAPLQVKPLHLPLMGSHGSSDLSPLGCPRTLLAVLLHSWEAQVDWPPKHSLPRPKRTAITCCQESMPLSDCLPPYEITTPQVVWGGGSEPGKLRKASKFW